MKLKTVRILTLAAAVSIGSIGPVLSMGSNSDESSASADKNIDLAPIIQLVEAEKYQDAIDALRKLEADENADVLNYLGYSHRKLGKMRAAKTYYQRALRADPNHLGALEYYGEWHVDNDDLDGANKYLERLQAACGECKEYNTLKAAIEDKAGS